ncbi:hypothetical protein ACFE04_031168 [Oxalis oulophora]
MEIKVISSVMLILTMFVFTVVAKKPNTCPFDSWTNCVHKCLPECRFFDPDKNCPVLCKETCSPCPGAPPSSTDHIEIDNNLSSTSGTNEVMEGNGPPCSVPRAECNNQCLATFSGLGRICVALCKFSCSSCPPSNVA